MSRSVGSGLVVLGDALLDVDLDGHAERLCPDAPAPVIAGAVERARPGGAALAAVMAAGDGRDGREVTLVTAIPDDEAGRRLRSLLEDAAVRVVDVGPLAPGHATAEKVRVRAGGQVIARVDRGGARTAPEGPLSGAAVQALAEAAVVLVSDYGRGVAAHAPVRAALAAAPTGRHIVWDPHPRGPAPVPGVLVATPNQREAEAAGGGPVRTLSELTRTAQVLAARWSARAIAVTRGDQGALLVQGAGTPLVVPARASRGDTCGAGDRFAASLAGRVLDGAVLSEAVVDAVAEATAYVAAGGPATLTPDLAPRGAARPSGAVAEVRAAGGTIVATGGCFDVLHAGHVQLLQRARLLGDALVVLLNSDRSVRELKGPGRPLVTAADRAAVLAALGCVDEVVEFDEPTPAAALARLRPDIFVKGGDYAAAELPEQAVMAAWDGQCVVVPYLDGRSTTTMYQEVVRRGLA